MHSCLFVFSCVNSAVWLQGCVAALLQGPLEIVVTWLRGFVAASFVRAPESAVVWLGGLSWRCCEGLLKLLFGREGCCGIVLRAS